MGPAKVTSSLLYTLVAEVLGAAIRNCKDIRRVRLPGSSEESKIGQYADDGDLTLVDDSSISKAFEIIHIYEKGSGCRLNLGKTEGMWFGSMTGRRDGPVDIKWRTDCIKVLGIFYTIPSGDFVCLNWNFRIEKLAKRLESWKFRNLSLKGKSMIINTLALSGLWYTGSVVPLPAWAEKKMNQIIFDFLWSGKNEQIKRAVCYLPQELDGLSVVNVALKCKALLSRSVVFITGSQYKAKWVYLARYFIGRDLGKLHEPWGFLKCHTKPHAWSAPSYYQSVASAAKDIKEVFIAFVGKSLAVKVIYAELLSVELGFVPELSGKISLAGPPPGLKFIFTHTEVFLRIKNTMSFLRCFIMCLRRVSISVPGIIFILVWIALSAQVSWRL